MNFTTPFSMRCSQRLFSGSPFATAVGVCVTPTQRRRHAWDSTALDVRLAFLREELKRKDAGSVGWMAELGTGALDAPVASISSSS
jgi:hypothetical protein